MAATDTLLPLDDGPWTQMLDSVAPTTRKRGAYLLGQNIYPLDPSKGDGVVGRPGVRTMGAQLGAVGRRRGQGTYQFTKKNGTEITVQIVGGFFYTLNWGTEVWTEVVTNANLTTATITLDQTAHIAFLTVGDKLFVSDGVNVPWLWDGTAGAGGLTKLTNCPVLFGQPTLYNYRIFGILASDRASFVWSETDQPNTGYTSGGFNNIWTLTQTDPNQLMALSGDNDGVMVFRARSATAISGDVTTNFSTTGTRESLSANDGTTSPFAIVRTDLDVMILNADIHPELVRAGGAGFTDLWTPFRETLKKVPKTLGALCMGVLYPPASLVLIAIPDVGATECNMLLVYDVKGSIPVPVAVWRGWTMTTLAMVKSGVAASLGVPYLFHSDANGYVYLHGNPEDTTPWDDFLSTGTVAIEHVLEEQPIGYNTKQEKIFDRLDLSIRAFTRMTLELSLITPRGRSTVQTLVMDNGVLGWDVMLFDDIGVFDQDVTLTTQEAHGDVGLNEQARWARTRIRHNTLGEQFGLIALSLTAYTTDDDPAVP